MDDADKTRRQPDTERAIEIATCYVMGAAANDVHDTAAANDLFAEGHRLIVQAHLLGQLPAVAQALAVELTGTWQAYSQCLERDPVDVWRSVRLVDAEVRARDDGDDGPG